MSGEAKRIDVDGVTALADILLAAAFADGKFVGEESAEIERILQDRLGVETLPDEVVQHIWNFDPEDFDLSASCRRFHLKGPDDRRSLLRLVADVVEADQIHDMDEDAFIRQVAAEIGSEPEEYEDLTVDIISISALTAPPPIPGDAD